MHINRLSVIDRFLRKNASARNPMAAWIQKTEAALWEKFADVKDTFNSADYKKPYTIFDVGGNNYRILSQIDYPIQTVTIIKVATHKEYLSTRGRLQMNGITPRSPPLSVPA